MNQKQQYTEFWELLSLTEDYIKYGKKSGEYTIPDFTEAADSLQTNAPEVESPGLEIRPNREHPLIRLPSDNACRNCGMAKMGKKPLGAVGCETPRLLILCGPPSVGAEQNQIPLAAEEMDYVLKWISAIDLSLERDVMLLNFPRCRPPGNRPPFPEEMNGCASVVRTFIGKHKPSVILTLGPVPSAYFTGNPGLKVSEIREGVAQWEGVPVLSTYSPDQVLTYHELKRPVWEDLKRVRNFINGA